MLRRQIENTKYIPLSEEFNNLIKNNHQILDETTENLDKIYFVIPDVKMQRGYYATEMKIITLGKIKDLKLSSTAP
ncbi:hypothetical protein [Candidatus Coxiella mudrowiae]|uniref:hypothetical protein n=1 Tax=Candidatus Coxiella mudrowiae TaxID=2054173 RepID=UPI00069E6961|nr:hypothetical protein [Candidatus Coxiella mudrowiae]